MPLLGNTKQNKNCSIRAFYEEMANCKENSGWQRIGRNMLAIVDLINQTFIHTPIWGLTSHSILLLQTKDKWYSDWYVAIDCKSGPEYYFEYRLPKERRLNENETEKLIAADMSEAKSCLLIAMRESEAWKGSAELVEILLKNGL
jgi:hypothetical protein